MGLDPFTDSLGFILLTLNKGAGGLTSGWMMAGLKILGKSEELFDSINLLYSFYFYFAGMSSDSLYPSESYSELS